MNEVLGKYCIVRGRYSGVFAGVVREINGDQVLMTGLRRIWYWDGAASISQLAAEGTTAPKNCKFTVVVESALIMDVIEIIPCTAEAEANIKAVKEWKR